MSAEITKESAEEALAEAEKQAAAVTLLAETLPNFRKTTDWPAIATLARAGAEWMFAGREIDPAQASDVARAIKAELRLQWGAAPGETMTGKAYELDCDRLARSAIAAMKE